MTEKAATKGTSAGSAERKPADDSAFTEEADQPDATAGQRPDPEGLDDPPAPATAAEPASDKTTESAVAEPTAAEPAEPTAAEPAAGKPAGSGKSGPRPGKPGPKPGKPGPKAGGSGSRASGRAAGEDAPAGSGPVTEAGASHPAGSSAVAAESLSPGTVTAAEGRSVTAADRATDQPPAVDDPGPAAARGGLGTSSDPASHGGQRSGSSVGGPTAGRWHDEYDSGTTPSSPNGATGADPELERPRPTFTRPPGMVPPPAFLAEPTGQPAWAAGTPAPGNPAPGTPASSAPVAGRSISDPPVSGPPVSGPPVSGPPVSGGGWGVGGQSASGAFPTINASAPVSAPPRVTGRSQTGGVTVRPIGPESTAAGPELGGATPVGEPIRPRPAATPRGPRRARLNLKRIDPWSVMKFSFAVSLVLFIVVIVAASVLYLALDAMGVFSSINNTVAELIQSGAGEGVDSFRITAQGVIGTAAVLGALNVLLFTSLATLGAFIYNVCADLVGGVEVTLAERD